MSLTSLIRQIFSNTQGIKGTGWSTGTLQAIYDKPTMPGDYDGVYLDGNVGDTLLNGATGTPNKPLSVIEEAATVAVANKLSRIYCSGPVAPVADLPQAFTGKRKRRLDGRNFQLRAILKTLPPIPASFDVDSQFQAPLPMPMFANDEKGDCVIAGRAHQTLRTHFHPALPARGRRP